MLIATLQRAMGWRRCIEVSKDELLLVNLVKPSDPNYFKDFNTLHHHYIWNKNTRKFKRWNATDRFVIAYNSSYLLTSNALHARRGLNLTKIKSLPDKYYNA